LWGGPNPKTKLLLRDLEDGEGKNFRVKEKKIFVFKEKFKVVPHTCGALVSYDIFSFFKIKFIMALMSLSGALGGSRYME
jgi:hypothetical protein